MRLLVSVRDADEARAALGGGADIIDAKEPSRGALGAVGASALGDVVAAVRGARAAAAGTGVIAVAYADADRARSVAATPLVDVAAAVGAAGVLLDTAFKDSAGLFALVRESAVGAWVEAAHAAGLMAAVAGKLSPDDLPLAGALGADVAGVRGAACEGGRAGRVRAERVAALVDALRGASRGRECLGGPEPSVRRT